MKSPYQDLPSQNFWKTAVASNHWSNLSNLYRRKFEITADTKIATAGSCFAQHIASHLRKNGFSVLDYEPGPSGLDDASAKNFGFSLYSARYGNIYVVRHLLQLLRETWGEAVNHDPVWEANGRYFDSMRPSVEPHGLDSPEEAIAHRLQHLARVKKLFTDANLVIFTLGLTESWMNRHTHQIYPLCPGTVAGTFDPERHIFKNFTYDEILEDFAACREFIKERNKFVRFLLTVSPIPLTATASQNHVLTATMYSKSVLRAVAGHLTDTYADVDYFPSYEIIASPWGGGSYYERNLREVNSQGVETVMQAFFAAHGSHVVASDAMAATKLNEEIVCDELLLEAFAR